MIFLLLVVTIIVITNSCKDNGTQPPVNNYKHPRDMAWEIDTIAYEGSDQTVMTSMFATSSKDIWITGHNDRSRGNLWHLDGEKWEAINLFSQIEQSANSLSKVSGFSTTNNWVVGYRVFAKNQDFILERTGNVWKEHKQNTTFRILALHCNAKNDIWVGGDSGFIAQYNGTTWNRDTINIGLESDSEFFIKGLARYDDETYVLLSNFKSAYEKYFFIKGNINNWQLIDSIYYDGNTFNIKWGYSDLYKSPWEKLYSVGPGGIWEWQSGWSNILKLNFPIYGMYGVKENYLLAVGDFGHVYFYNGTTWEQLTEFANTSNYIVYTDVWTDGYEVIVLGHTVVGFPQKTIIWRGK